MSILQSLTRESKLKDELHTHTAYCFTCPEEFLPGGVLYSTGRHIAGSEWDVLGHARAERMAKMHAETNRGHRTQVFLSSENIAGAAFIYQDQEVRS